MELEDRTDASPAGASPVADEERADEVAAAGSSGEGQRFQVLSTALAFYAGASRAWERLVLQFMTPPTDAMERAKRWAGFQFAVELWGVLHLLVSRSWMLRYLVGTVEVMVFIMQLAFCSSITLRTSSPRSTFLSYSCVSSIGSVEALFMCFMLIAASSYLSNICTAPPPPPPPADVGMYEEAVLCCGDCLVGLLVAGITYIFLLVFRVMTVVHGCQVHRVVQAPPGGAPFAPPGRPQPGQIPPIVLVTDDLDDPPEGMDGLDSEAVVAAAARARAGESAKPDNLVTFCIVVEPDGSRTLATPYREDGTAEPVLALAGNAEPAPTAPDNESASVAENDAIPIAAPAPPPPLMVRELEETVLTRAPNLSAPALREATLPGTPENEIH